MNVVEKAVALREANEAAAAFFKENYGTAEGLYAIAADVVLPMIEADVMAEDITMLLLDEVPSQKGDIRWAKKPKHKAYYIGEDGNFKASPDEAAYVTPDPRLLTCEPEFNKLEMERGHIGSLDEQREAATDAIVKSKNSEVVSMLVNGVDATMEFTHAATLDKGTLDDAITAGEDQGLRPVLIVMRGTRGGDIKDYTLPQTVSADLLTKGVQGIVYSGAQIMYTPDMGTDEVLVIFDKKAGRIMTEFELTADDVVSAGGVKLKMPMYTVYRAAMTNTKRVAVITIT